MHFDNVEEQHTNRDCKVVHEEESVGSAGDEVEVKVDHQWVDEDMEVLSLFSHLDAWRIIVINLLYIFGLSFKVHLTLLCLKFSLFIT